MDREQRYKVISSQECHFEVDSTYKIDLLLFKRSGNMPVNLAIEYCVSNKRDRICSDAEYTHLYKLQSSCNTKN